MSHLRIPHSCIPHPGPTGPARSARRHGAPAAGGALHGTGTIA